MAKPLRIRVLGAGVAGLTAAFAFAHAGCAVELIETREAPGLGCSHYAGGMLAPWCEAESAEALITELGVESLAFWTQTLPVASQRGTLVVAPARDRPELTRFSRRASGYEPIEAEEIARLEPDLAGRFTEALYFPREAHLDPRLALTLLASRLETFENVALRYGEEAECARENGVGWTIDCRGLEARKDWPQLRGVRGEMLLLATKEISLARPIRLIHPRHPVYVAPRAPGLFMVGATMVENDEAGRVTARAMMELLGAAYAIHPAFAEAEIVETGSGVRPAFPDNLPRLRLGERRIEINGLYRHGFLVAPALARRAVEVALQGAYFPEVMDADPGERQSA